MKTRTHIYWRDRGGVRRAYADLREYADVGGGREALVARGERLATRDPATAQVLLARRIEQLDGLRRGRTLHGLAGQTTLAAFAQQHLVAKAESGKFTEKWLAASEHFLTAAVGQFGDERELSSISVGDVSVWVKQLRAGRGRGTSSAATSGTVRHYLNALSNLYTRAQAEGFVLPGYNPVASLMDKPRAATHESRWLEVPDAALLLEAARRYRPTRGDLAIPFTYPLLATLLLTGGRLSEVLGLEVDDVSLDRETVTFRVNTWRRLKTEGSFRTVRLWPQLAEILRPYFPERERMGQGTLLFPSFRTGTEGMVQDLHRVLDSVAEQAGWKAGEIRSKMFRHTYTAARLQTLDQGAPVSVYTVRKELGHGSTAMVERVYAHLGQVRHRSEVVEYRVEQHRTVLGDRLAALRFGTAIGTTPSAGG